MTAKRRCANSQRSGEIPQLSPFLQELAKAPFITQGYLFLIAEKERVCKENEGLETALNEYKIRLQNADQDLFIKNNVIAVLIFTITCLQQSEPRLKADSKASFLLIQSSRTNQSKHPT